MKDPVEQGCRPALRAATSGEVVTDGIQENYVTSSCPIRTGMGKEIPGGQMLTVWGTNCAG